MDIEKKIMKTKLREILQGNFLEERKISKKELREFLNIFKFSISLNSPEYF